MLFTDIVFLIFMLVVFVLYWLVLRRWTGAQNVLLLASSYLFYGWWDRRFLGLIILTTLTTFLTALGARGRYGKLLTWGNVFFNLGLLFVFKYFNFFRENIQRLFDLVGINLGWFTIDVLLPVGISFYTFQAVAYSVDVRRGTIGANRNLLSFATFIAYFPQLVAGPIMRASELLPQIERPRRWDSRYAVSGMRMLLIGVIKKICIADMLSVYVTGLYDAEVMTAVRVLKIGILFSLEIYFDFSGYCDIARGVSRLLGIELMANFRFPYFSRDVREFWQRWHISLMRWFTDYVYIPLGGNRHGMWRTICNSAIVFVLSGLWHGASWNFVLWGVYWAIVYNLWRLVWGFKRFGDDIGFDDLPRIIATMAFVFFGFFIFRCSTAEQLIAGAKAVWLYAICFALAWFVAKVMCRYAVVRIAGIVVLALAVVGGIVKISAQWPVALYYWWMVPLAVVAVIEWFNRNQDYPLERVPVRRWQRLALYVFCMMLIVISEPIDMAFIYFQF